MSAMPPLQSTEDALAFGETLSATSYRSCRSLRASLLRDWRRCRKVYYLTSNQSALRDMITISFRAQLLREAMEVFEAAHSSS